MGLQPMETKWPSAAASRQRRLAARRLREYYPALVAQPSLRDGCPSWIFAPGAKATRLPSRHRYAAAPLARRRNLFRTLRLIARRFRLIAPALPHKLSSVLRNLEAC